MHLRRGDQVVREARVGDDHEAVGVEAGEPHSQVVPGRATVPHVKGVVDVAEPYFPVESGSLS